MKSLLIIGAGQYGQLVKELAEAMGYQKIDFLDDSAIDAVGNLQDVTVMQEEYDGCIVAIGNSEIKKRMYQNIKNPVTLIHPSTVISNSAVIEAGCVIEANAVIHTAAAIEIGTFICSGVVVNHNSIVKSFSQIDCNAVVAAGTIVPEGTKVLPCTVWNKKPQMPVGDESFF
ncbi:MAG: hypothetical protein PHW34_00775 [Hespellia sp.]|nr:hypothetical protein [Hespellia sp.]